MTEMTWITMHIGGPLPENKIGELCEAIDEDFSGNRPTEGWEAAIHTAIGGNDTFFVDGEVNYGDADAVEAFCLEYGLTFHVHWDAKPGCFDAGCKVSGPDHYQEGGADEYGPTISLTELKDHRDQGRSVEQIIERLEPLNASNVPPLTLGPSWVDEENDNKTANA